MLKKQVFSTIYSQLGGEQIDLCLSYVYLCEVKCKQSRLRFELGSPIPFPMMLNVTGNTPGFLAYYIVEILGGS